MPIYRKIEVGETIIPEEAIDLIEDIQTLDRVLGLLETIRQKSVTVPLGDVAKANLESRQMLRLIGFLVSSLHSVAQDNLRFQYLCGTKIRPRQRRQTLADVWRILMDGKINLNDSKGDLSK